MHWIDYLIVLIPLLTVIYVGYRSRKYVGNVTDFLTAGRVAGRYVIAVAGGEAAMGLISVVAMMEMYCHTGFAVPFWGRLAGIAAFFYIITGYCTYRFRETRAMTLGQFFGKRYSQKFRFWAAILQSTSGILNYALFPAVGARFFVYFLDLPIQVTCLGMRFPTFGLLMFIFLSIALLQALWGGQVTLMITDCIQGILHYPMYMIIVFFIFWKFSWDQEMLPALLDRPDGKSFLNPYDIRELRDFNLFYVMSGIFMGIFMRMTWSGAQGYAGAAISAHEQKMGGILSYWRSGFAVMMYIMLAVAAITYLNHGNYRVEASRVNRFLSLKTFEDVVADNPILRERMDSTVGDAAAKSASESAGAPDYHELVRQSLREQDKAKAQTFDAIYRQMQVTVAVRDMLPVGLTGIFCAMMVFMLLGTDSTYMHSWGSILAQDLILPWRKKPFTPKQQLLVLRICISMVAVFAFFFSLYYAQIDYILMFFAITGAIFATGAGPCIVFGLYSRWGNTAGAFCALFAGSFLSVGGIVCQQTWATRIYPFLKEAGWLPAVTAVIETIGGLFAPYISWVVTPYHFPINSQEMALLSMLISIGLYCGVSLLTSQGRRFNLDEMLHRGKYRVEDEDGAKTRVGWVEKLIGVTSEYNTADRVLAWSVFSYQVIFNTVICFALVVIWNRIRPWNDAAWGWYFFITNIVVAGVIGLISTVWFTIGGTLGLIQLFRRLEQKRTDSRDDGRD